MAGPKKHRYQRVSVSASELAQMGVCERLAVFEYRYGKRRTVEQRQAIQRGLRAHQRFYVARNADTTGPGRYCGAFLACGRRLILGVVRWIQARKQRDDT